MTSRVRKLYMRVVFFFFHFDGNLKIKYHGEMGT